MTMTRIAAGVLAGSLFMGLALPVCAEPAPVRLTLNDAVRLSFQRNLDLKVELYNPAQAQADIYRALGIYDPALNLSVNYSRSSTTETFFFTPINIDTFTASAGVSELLPTGGTLGVNASSGWISNSNSYYNNGLTLNASQPLLRNFGRENTELTIQVARFGKEGSLARYQTKLTDTVAQVRNDYFRLYNLREVLQVKRTSLALANKILEETRGRVKAGVLPAMEILNAEFSAAAREKDVIDAERAVRDQVDVLRQSLQLEGGGDIETSEPPIREFITIAEGEALTRALASRPELAAQRVTLQVDELQRRVARNRTLPDLSVNANFGFQGYDPRFLGAYERTAKADFPTWGIGLQFSYPIGNRAAENDYIKSKLALEQAQTQLRNLESGVVNEVRAALRLVDTSFRQIEVTSRGTAYAEERLRAFRTKNAVGLATTKDVFDVENDLVNAKASQIQALVDYNNALTTLWRVTGELLERQGIKVSAAQAEELYDSAR
ncbi:RND transporter [Geomonas limicola]|uniref:RND transporter n=2 Tax=Geomonas limicola TaxID=2740186 RepID=A0A6V8NBN7_9BACT|nr:RND transporter [Geomonas limicola]